MHEECPFSQLFLSLDSKVTYKVPFKNQLAWVHKIIMSNSLAKHMHIVPKSAFIIGFSKMST